PGSPGPAPSARSGAGTRRRQPDRAAARPARLTCVAPATRPLLRVVPHRASAAESGDTVLPNGRGRAREGGSPPDISEPAASRGPIAPHLPDPPPNPRWQRGFRASRRRPFVPGIRASRVETRNPARGRVLAAPSVGGQRLRSDRASLARLATRLLSLPIRRVSMRLSLLAGAPAYAAVLLSAAASAQRPPD